MKVSNFGFVCLSLLLFSLGVTAQNSVGGIETKGMDMNAFPFGTISEIGFVAPSTLGTNYLNPTWYVGDIYLKSGESINDYPLKFDLQNNFIEIQTDKGIKVLEGSRIEGFTWFDGTSTKEFINPSGLHFEDRIGDGFLQIVLLGDTWSLYKVTSLKIVESNYNPTLDMGNRDNKIVQKEELLVANKSQLFEIPKSRKKFSSLFVGKEDSVFEFVKVNDLDTREENDLKDVIEFLNGG